MWELKKTPQMWRFYRVHDYSGVFFFRFFFFSKLSRFRSLGVVGLAKK